MSADKNRRERRRMELLHRASSCPLYFHMEGGWAMHDPDVQRLVRDGLLVFRRMDYAGRSMPVKGSPEFMSRVHRQHLHGRVVRTRGVITDKGREALAAFPTPLMEYSLLYGEMVYRYSDTYPANQRGTRFR